MVGGFASGSMYSYYLPEVTSNLSIESPIGMIASYGITGNDVAVNVQISVDQTITTTNNNVYFVVIEDDVHNGHNNVARAVLESEPFLLSTIGESVSINRIFTLDPTWKVDDIEIVVFVQPSSGNLMVLQATKALASYVGSVTVATDPPGLGAGWTLEGPNGYYVVGTDGMLLAVFDEGDYTLTWGDVEGWTSPSPTVVSGTMVTDGTIDFLGVFTDGPFTPLTSGDLGHGGPSSGVAMVDFDQDGDLDIHVINTGSADLLLSNDSGVFTNVGVGLSADEGAGVASAWADYDNDGDLDFYLSKLNEVNVLARNDGGVFVNANFSAIGDAGPGAGVAWADYDLDGKVDLYLCNDDGANILFQNYGTLGADWLFLAQTSIMQDTGSSHGVNWGDYDNDGDPDIYFTNGPGFNRLYRNDLEYDFSQVFNAVVSNTGNGSGCAWGDYNNDGNLDFYAAVDGGEDQLIKNQDGIFLIVPGSPASSVANTRGLAWGDYDNDGDLDLYQGKGGQFDRLLRNDGGDVFTEIALGVLETGGMTNSVAWGDVDGDGDLDLYVANGLGGNALLQNDLDNGNHWLHLRLTGVTSNLAAIGARAELTANGVTQIREVTAGSGLNSQQCMDLEFGLGVAGVVDSLVIRWPSGTVQTFLYPPIDQVLEIAENLTTAVEREQDAPKVVQLHRAYPNPFNPSTKVSFDLPREGRATMTVYDVAGRLVKVLWDEVLPAGTHDTLWLGDDAQGRSVAAGTYLLRLEASGVRQVQQLTLVK